MEFFGKHILSVVLFTPLVGSLLALFIPRENAQAHRILGNVFGFLGLIVSLPLIWRFQPGQRLPTPIRYRVALTGGDTTAYDIVVAGDQATVEPAGTVVADVRLRCDPETCVLLMLGRLPLADALAQRRLVAEGAREQVAAFTQWFRWA